MKKYILAILLISLLVVTNIVVAEEFDWRAYEGETINVYLSEHPYVNALLEEIDEFEKLTGITVNTNINAEEQHFDNITVNLAAGSPNIDVFMLGAYQTWAYASAGWLEELDNYMNDSNLTSSAWDQDDFIDPVINSLRWNLEPGSELGTEDAKQLALPWGFELNPLVYRKDIFDKHNLEPPKTYPEILEVGKKLKKLNPDKIIFHARGLRHWNTLHPGFISAYSDYGAEDFDENMNPKMNSPEAIKFTKLFIKIMQEIGPPNDTWTNYGPWDITADLGSGKALMFHDATILGYNANTDTEVAGKLAFAPSPGAPGSDSMGSNIWIWSLGMSEFSEKKEAAWYFLQWVTGKDYLTTAAVDYTHVDPVRESIWENEDFLARLERHDGYKETFDAMVDDSKILFTPQPYFFDVTTTWAEGLQKIYHNEKTAEEAMNEVVSKIKETLEREGVYE